VSTSASVKAYLARRNSLIDAGQKLARDLAASYFDELQDGHPPGVGPKARRLREQLEKLANGLKQGDAALNAILQAIGEQPSDSGIESLVAGWTDHCQGAFDGACQLGRSHLRRLGQDVPEPNSPPSPVNLSRAQYEQLSPEQRAAVLRALGAR
jgi:hypothetical protein